MGYVPEHPRFPKPDDLDATLWRYMDFTKLVALLHARALYFSRADQLDDRFDGSVSEKTRLYRWAIHSELEPIKRAHLSGQLSFINEVMPRHTHLNCWSIAPRESAALWRVFVPTDEGVAVRSTFRRLTESLPADEGPDIFVGMVTYLDYDNEWVPEGNTSAPFMHKRAYYDYESEVRALIQDIPTRDGQADSSSPGPRAFSSQSISTSLSPVSASRRSPQTTSSNWSSLSSSATGSRAPLPSPRWRAPRRIDPPQAQFARGSRLRARRGAISLHHRARASA